MTESVTERWRLGRDPRAAGSQASPGGLIRLHVLMALRTWACRGVARRFDLVERKHGPGHLDVVLHVPHDDAAAEGELLRELSLRGLARQRLGTGDDESQLHAVEDDETQTPRLDLRSLLERSRTTLRAPRRA